MQHPLSYCHQLFLQHRLKRLAKVVQGSLRSYQDQHLILVECRLPPALKLEVQSSCTSSQRLVSEFQELHDASSRPSRLSMKFAKSDCTRSKVHVESGSGPISEKPVPIRQPEVDICHLVPDSLAFVGCQLNWTVRCGIEGKQSTEQREDQWINEWMPHRSSGNTRYIYLKSVLSHALSRAIYQTIERGPRVYDPAMCVTYTNERKYINEMKHTNKAYAIGKRMNEIKYPNISLVPVPWSHGHMWRMHTMVDMD